MIQKLSDEVIGKIAAGEVIERPAYIVKELVENALDADANVITIHLKKGGNESIQVIDNGTGISHDEIKKAVLPHYTSKIITLTDLSKVKSYGFRGEALASIAAVSNVVIESKTKKETGISIRIKKGIQEIRPVGIAQGTRISVSEIFSHIPARRKFMKSPASEYRLILHMICEFALAHPTIEFSVTNNGSVTLHVTKSPSLRDRIIDIYGAHIDSDLLPVETHDSYVKLTGYIARPQRTYKTQQHMHMLVNGRPVQDATLAAAVKDAYHHLLSTNEYPFCVCIVTVPPEYIDVNIHPRKERIAFYNQQEVYGFIFAGVSDALTKANLTFANIGWKKSAPHSKLKSKMHADPIASLGHVPSTEDILQIADTYLFVETTAGVMVIDQHAAHEAILYRTLLGLFDSDQSSKRQITLDPPLLIAQSALEIAALIHARDALENMGFEIEPFGVDTIRVSAIPALFEGYNITEFLSEFFETSTEVFRNKLDTQTKKILSTIACKSAIKAGHRLSKQQRIDLINRLQSEDYVYTCPHGRPVKIEITSEALARMFKR